MIDIKFLRENPCLLYTSSWIYRSRMDRWQDRNKENWYPDQCPGADCSSLLSDTCNSITLYLAADPCSYAWWTVSYTHLWRKEE